MKIVQVGRWILYGVLCFLLLSCATASNGTEKGVINHSDQPQLEKSKIQEQIGKADSQDKKSDEKTLTETASLSDYKSTKDEQNSSVNAISKKKTIKKTPPKKAPKKKQKRTAVKSKKKVKKKSKTQAIKKSPARKVTVKNEASNADNTAHNKIRSAIVEKKPVAKIEPDVDNVTDLTTLCVPQYPRKTVTVLDVVNLKRDIKHFGRGVLRNLKTELAKNHDLVEDVQVKIVLNVHSYTLQGLLKDQLQIINGNIKTDLIIFGIDLFDNALDGVLILFVRNGNVASSCYKWFIKASADVSTIEDVDRSAFQEQLILLAQNDLPAFIRTVKVLYVVEKIRKSSPHLFAVLISSEQSDLFQKFQRRNPDFSQEMIKLKKELSYVTETVPGYMDEIEMLIK